MPGAREVYVQESMGGRTRLSRDREGRWGGGATVSKGVAEVGVYAKTGEKTPAWLLSYQV